ncbi:MAG: D-alanine--D-alanine ligase [Chloroflexi bacterium]|nr:D-alanine--D-alanine ligase [Chloroflexota bacterium]
MGNLTNNRLRVGVVLGGMSSEREISLESGRNIYMNLDSQKYEGVAIFMDGQGHLWEIPLPLLVQNTTADIETRLNEAKRISYEALKERVDFVYIGLHGKYGEDGCFQGFLELLGIPYSGSGVLASAVGMDKHITRRILAAAELKVPKYLLVATKDWQTNPQAISGLVEDTLGYPCVVKPTREGCSTGLAVVRQPEKLPAAVEAAFAWDNAVLVEELLRGMEVTCGVIGNEEPMALLPSQTPPKGDFLTIEEKFLPGEGVNITPAPLPAEMLKKIQETMVAAYKVLGIKVYARIDGFVVDGEVVITEPNTLPGMTPSTVIFHQAAEAGMSPSQFIDRIIQLSLEAHAKKKGPLA